MRGSGAAFAALLLLAGSACGRHDGAAPGAEASAAAPQVASAPGPAAPAPAPAPPPAALDACALITQADADAVLGTPSKLADHPADDRHASHCNYTSVDESHGVNGFGVSVELEDSPAEAKTGQAIKQGIYSNFAVYELKPLSGVGDGAFLAVSKPPGPGLDSGPLAAMVGRQQVLELYKGSRDIEIIVSYFGKARTTDAVEALARDMASKV